MYFNKEPIVLASGSPRRQQYLEDLGIGFSVYSVPIDETPFKGEAADLFAVRMAREKAEAVSNQFHRSWVIGGDTVVCLGREILGKPLDNEDAFSMLMSLSGKEHTVRTGIFLCHAEKKIYDQRIVETKVVFADFDESIARGYVNTGECLDKAGAYGIQGKGAVLVRAIKGSYSNVVGLPLFELIEMLRYYRVVEPRC
jgi:septum formation protein